MPVIMEGVMRGVFAFIVLLVLARLVGKQSFSQLTFFDFISGVAIGGMGALLAAGLTVNVWGIFAALMAFVVLMILNGYLVLESRPLRKLVRGGPVVVVHNGRMLRENMVRLRMSEDDLMTRLQEKGGFEPDDIEAAVLEEDSGQLSILPRGRERNNTTKPEHNDTEPGKA